MWGDRRSSNPRHAEPQSAALPTELRLHGAVDGIRTRGLLVGNQMLCQLSYYCMVERGIYIEASNTRRRASPRFRASSKESPNSKRTTRSAHHTISGYSCTSPRMLGGRCRIRTCGPRRVDSLANCWFQPLTQPPR